MTLQRLADPVVGGAVVAVEEKDSRCAGVGPAVKVNTSGAEVGLALGQAALILTEPKERHGSKLREIAESEP